MKYVKIRRENNIYYRTRRRAVGSHTRWGDRNPSGLSSYLKGEREMTAEDRKNSRLPSGWTIAKSWAALRKCWLGFYITKDQGDRDGMVEFAKRIRKIQAELGIEPTNFDSDILDADTVNRIDALYRKPLAPSTQAFSEDEQSAKETTDIDYSEIMSLSGNNSDSMPAPRQEIFRENRKSCASPAIQPNALVDVKVIDYENSCYFGPPKPAYPSKIRVKRIKTIYKNQCQAPPTNEWENNFAVSAPENTLAVPDPNKPPIQPILRSKYCVHRPAEEPPHTIHQDKSCEYDPSQSQIQSSKKDKVIQRTAKSCRYNGEP